MADGTASPKVIDCALSSSRVFKCFAGSVGDNRARIRIHCQKCDQVQELHGKSFWNVTSVAERFRKRGWDVDAEGKDARCPLCKIRKRDQGAGEILVGKSTAPPPPKDPPVVAASSPKMVATVTKTMNEVLARSEKGKPKPKPKVTVHPPPAKPSKTSTPPAKPPKHVPPTRGTGPIIPTWETITPQQAKTYLATRTGPQRPVMRTSVREYRDAMETGKFRGDNGETIKFDWNGELADGQHRLTAQVEADVTVSYLVVRGIDPAVFDTIDRGRSRSPANLIAIAGLGPNPNLVAAVSAALMQLEDAFADGLFSTTHKPAQLVKDYAVAHTHEINDMRDFGQHAKYGELVFPSAVGAAIVFLRRHVDDKSELVEFFSRVMTGANLAADSIGLLLRGKLQGQRGSGDMSRADVMAYCIQGWGMHLRGLNRGLQVRYTDGSLNMPLVYVNEKLCLHPDGRRVTKSVVAKYYEGESA